MCDFGIFVIWSLIARKVLIFPNDLYVWGMGGRKEEEGNGEEERDQTGRQTDRRDGDRVSLYSPGWPGIFDTHRPPTLKRFTCLCLPLCCLLAGIRHTSTSLSLVFSFFRQFIMQHRLDLKSQSSFPDLPSVGITGMHHYVQFAQGGRLTSAEPPDSSSRQLLQIAPSDRS